MTELVVGQTLWYYRDRYPAEPIKVIITSVGRKWAYLNRETDRISRETLWADGGTYASPGRCWLSQEDHDRAMRADQDWLTLERKMGRRPDHVTSFDIRAAAAHLGIEL